MKIGEVEVEVEFEDVIDYIKYDASQYELEKIKKEISYSETDEESDFPINNLYDREKVLILKEAMKRYNLDQLVEKLGIIQAESM